MKSLAIRLVFNFRKIRIELIGWSIYLALSIYSALNISSIRYGSPDDLSIASMQFGKIGTLENSIESAKQTGRIQQIPFYILNSFGLRENPIFLTQTIKFISAVTILFLFTYLVKKLYGQNISLIASLVLISTFATTGEYNSINSFPLWFSLGVITFIASCLSFISYLSTRSTFFLVVTLILFGTSLLASEIYFVLVVIFPLIQIKIERSSFFQTNFFNVKRFYLSLSALTLTYFATYLIFKLQSKGSYEGTEITFANPIKSLLSTLLLSFGQFNVYGLKRVLVESTLEINIFFLIIFLILLIFIYFGLVKFQKAFKPITGKEISVVFILGLGANILLGFTTKYSKIGLIYPLYLHSLISYLFISLVVAILSIKLAKIRLFAFILSIIISATGYISFVDQTREYALLRNNQVVFSAVDCLASNQVFAKNLEKQVVSESIQIASKAYTYNYFGDKLGKLLDKDVYFYRYISEIDKNSPYTVIDLSLVNGMAIGSFKTIRNGSVISGKFMISDSTCNIN